MLGTIAREYSRGWGHITTRQNVQFHFVALERIPALMRDLGAVGLTTREACGDTVRNVAGCHLAGACPFEVLDISPWAEATFRHFLRHPYGQRLPRKFKINFSGCATDCGQAMFNDVGVVAVTRARPDGACEAGFRVFVAGGLGATPHPAQALEEFTSRDDLLATIEAILRVFDHAGNRDNKLRARMKWLVDTLGIDEVRTPGPQGTPPAARRRRLARRDPGGRRRAGRRPGRHLPRRLRARLGPAGRVPVEIAGGNPYARWERANVVRGVARGTVSAYAHCRLGDVTADQFDGLAALQRRLGAEVRVTNRQNVVFRGLDESQLPELHAGLDALGLGRPGAELARDVVSCPGADTCNLAVTQSRGLASAIDAALDEAGLAEVGGVRVNISGCSNSCGQHHTADIGFFGLERRAHGRPAPGYQLLLGGHLGTPRSSSAARRCGCRPRPAPKPPSGSSAALPPNGRRPRRSPAGWTGSAVPPPWPASSPTWPSSPPLTRTPPSTSTSTRPAPSPPRSAPASAPADPLRLLGHQERELELRVPRHRDE